MVADMPNRTLTLGQRTKDKVARDILRDEAELPPPMRDVGRAFGGIIGLRRGGRIPGYFLGGVMKSGIKKGPIQGSGWGADTSGQGGGG